jgi:hypothetical protein
MEGRGAPVPRCRDLRADGHRHGGKRWRRLPGQPRRRTTIVGGITILPRNGPPPHAWDTPFLEGLHLASPARIILENASPSRSAGEHVSRCLTRRELEEYLDAIVRGNGVAALGKLRDEVRILASRFGMDAAWERIDRLVGALLGTREGQSESAVGVARSCGIPCDPDRVALFAKLIGELERSAPGVRPGDASEVFAFLEAYFSNCIEGVRFAADGARDIVPRGKIPKRRPKDAHDIAGTCRIVAHAVMPLREGHSGASWPSAGVLPLGVLAGALRPVQDAAAPPVGLPMHS